MISKQIDNGDISWEDNRYISLRKIREIKLHIGTYGSIEQIISSGNLAAVMRLEIGVGNENVGFGVCLWKGFFLWWVAEVRQQS